MHNEEDIAIDQLTDLPPIDRYAEKIYDTILYWSCRLGNFQEAELILKFGIRLMPVRKCEHRAGQPAYENCEERWDKVDHINAITTLREGKYALSETLCLFPLMNQEDIQGALATHVTDPDVRENGLSDMPRFVKKAANALHAIRYTFKSHYVNESLVSGLTEREKTCLMLLGEGYNIKSIARMMEVHEGTARKTQTRIMKKLGAENLPDLTRVGIKSGLCKL